MIKNLVFDMGGVLINFDPADRIARLGMTGERGRAFYDLLMAEPIWGKLDDASVETFAEALEIMVGRHPEMEAELRTYFTPDWFEIYSQRADGVHFLEKMRSQHFPIYILSNFSIEGYDYLERTHEFLKHVDGKIISCKVKQTKPKPEIYHTLLETYGLKAEETVFFDDLPGNIAGAEAVGIHGIRWVDAAQAEEDLLQLIKSES